MQPFFPSDFTYKVIKVNDVSSSNLIRHFPALIAFIKAGMASGGAVYVHCHAGVSRSATCVIAYLMQENSMSFDDAFSFASKQRPVIFPNMGFQRQLQEFEKLLNIKRGVAHSSSAVRSTNASKSLEKPIKYHLKGLGSVNVQRSNKQSSSLN